MRQLHDLAWRDFLTGLFNRRYFFDQAPKLMAESQRTSRSSLIAVIDIDHFKQLNDSFGHAAGDEALRNLAGHLSQEFAQRPHLLARLGGEEFALLLPGLGLREATHLTWSTSQPSNSSPAIELWQRRRLKMLLDFVDSTRAVRGRAHIRWRMNILS